MTKPKRALLTILLTMLIAVGCSEELSEPQRLAKAEEYLDRGDYTEASIELKNILQINPQNVAARTLLGQLLLSIGDSVSAEESFTKALSLDGNPEEIVPPLSRVYLNLGKYEQIEKLSFEGLSTTAEAELLAARGVAKLNQGNQTAATLLLDEAISLTPNSSQFILLAQARLASSKGEYSTARSLIASVLDSDPEYAEAFVVLGDLEWQAGNPEAAATAYTDALAGLPLSRIVRLKRALVNLQLSKYSLAQEDVTVLEKRMKGNPGANYVQAVIHFQNGKFEEALEPLQIAGTDETRYPLTSLYAASSHFALGNIQQADHYASRFFSLDPDNTGGRKLLATIRMNQKRYDEVIDLLTPVLEGEQLDSLTLKMMATALQRTNRLDRAVDVYEKAVEIDPDEANAYTALGKALLAAGDPHRALSHFEHAIKLEPSSQTAWEMLVLTYLRLQQDDEAIEVATSFRDNNPEWPSSHNLLGRALFATQQLAAAEHAFKRAAEIEPGNITACTILAEIALYREDLNAARRYYKSILEHSKNHLDTLIRLSSLDVQQGDEQGMLNHLQLAIESHPAAPEPRLVLARYYLLKRQPQKVTGLLEPLKDTDNDSPDVLRVLASAQLLLEQNQNASYTLERLIEQEPHNADSYISLAKVYMELNDPQKTNQALEKAIALDPDNFTARIALARLRLTQGDIAGAEKHLASLLSSSPEHPDVIQLDSLLAMKGGDQKRALELAEESLQHSESTTRMLMVANEKRKVGDHEGALRLQETWTSKYPEDTKARISLARSYIMEDRIDKAIAQFRAVLSVQPDNLTALNNLAWYMRDKEPELSLTYATKANQLSPDSPLVLDTLAMVLLANDMGKEARQTIDRAIKLAPELSPLKYHQAMILAAEDEPEAALNILKGIAEKESDFAGRESIEALMKELGSNK